VFAAVDEFEDYSAVRRKVENPEITDLPGTLTFVSQPLQRRFALGGPMGASAVGSSFIWEFRPTISCGKWS